MLVRVISLFIFITTAFATGIFVNPAPNADGSVILATGNTIDISWTNTADYDILSLGYYSTSNQTITWLISNSQTHPTSFKWTVDAVAQGFKLSASRIFTFYIVKDLNFGDPFRSSWFIIDDNLNIAGSTATVTGTGSGSTQTVTVLITSTSISTITARASSTPTVTVTVNTQGSTIQSTTSQLTGSQVTSSSTPTSTSASTAAAGNASSSSSLSTGAVAGIAVGATIAAFIIAILLYILFRQRKRLNEQNRNQAGRPETADNPQRPAEALGNAILNPYPYNNVAAVHQGQGQGQAADNPPRYELDRGRGAAELEWQRGNNNNTAELPGNFADHERGKPGAW